MEMELLIAFGIGVVVGSFSTVVRDYIAYKAWRREYESVAKDDQWMSLVEEEANLEAEDLKEKEKREEQYHGFFS